MDADVLPPAAAAMEAAHGRMRSRGHAPLPWIATMGGNQWYCACQHCGCTVVVPARQEPMGIALYVHCANLRGSANVKRAIARYRGHGARKC